MVSLLHYQPFKGLYLTYELFSTVFLRVPAWILTAIPKPWRPRARWSIGRSVKLKLTRHMVAITKRVGPLRQRPNYLAITPGLDVNGVWIPPIPELIKDELELWAKVSRVSSIQIPGYWQHKKGSTIDVAAPPMPGEKVVYALHGGGYTALSAHPSDPTAAIARGLLQHVDSVHRVFSCEYRLSSGDGLEAQNPFPAALLDALAGYVYLVKTVGLDPLDIIVEGDSAGGNLALALTRYLVEHPHSGLPATPGALILLSAWADLSPQVASPNSSWLDNAKSDYIGLVDEEGLVRSIRSFLGPHGLGAADANPMISPASRNPVMNVHFKGFPRTFIAAGGAEVFYDMLCYLKEKMVSDLGEGDGVRPEDGKVHWHCPPDATHDWVALPYHEPERSDTLKEIASWIVAT
ncbi:Alpha/Beta hydrolase protein [Lentinula aff. lateritia]|uniref:Alpha/Beta hydrolase protein n=1 Tax=Lentinula aff. lateritia TaxID=2804960 RepID=A0ACC1TUP4_9AGAR|nr:Alpha/Beta hydrolase protein [Lentinula aff. lateritia]